MRKTAIIAAAGWWGCGCLTSPPAHTQSFLEPLAGCPDALLPLGDGETPVSRLVKQLKGLSYEVYIGVGEPGCLWPWGIRDRIKQCGARSLTEAALEFGRVKSPWSEAKVEYCRQFGKVVEISDPDRKGKHLTFLKILETIEETSELVMLVCGDCLFTNALLKEIDAKAPCIFFTEHDEVLMLNEAGLEVWKDEILKKKVMLSAHYFIWHAVGTATEERFKAVGVPYFHMKKTYSHDRWNEQVDIDFADDSNFSTYGQALEWMERYGSK